MIEAYYCYARWGAKAKVFDLEIRYRQLLGPILQQPKISFSALETLSSITNSSTQISGSNIGNTLDFASVIQATQALSGTIELDQLLQQLTQIILKNSGADKCVLVLPQDGTWHVRAIATPEVTELCSVPLDDHPNVPIKLIQYVKRMQSVITIDNLQTNLPVIGDYLIQRQPKSVLCLPILNQGHLVGILYLKNQSTAGVFTSDRLTIIEFLCTQAAISLENARLYKRSQDYSQQLEQSLQQQETLFNVVANMRQSLDLPSIFRSITQEARAVLKADRVMVYRFDLDSAYNDGEIVAEDVLPAFPSALAARVQDHCFGENYVNLYQQGKIYAMDDLYAMNYQDCYRVILEQFQVRASLVAPILKNETLWGLLCIHQCSQPRHWNSSDVQFSQRVCAQLSIAVAQADLLGHTHLQAIELTKMLQKLQHAQIQIVQSEKMSALGNLVAGVAHEINNPIGFLSGNIQPALDYINDLFGLIDLYQQKYPQLDPEVKAEIEAIDLDYIREDLPKLVGSMREGVKRIWQISTSLRTFSRADTDHPVACNIHDGIDSTIMILKHRLKANETRPEIAVIKDYGDLPQVACYAGQLNQVFMNLLANAIDALDESNQDRTFTDIQASPNLITIKTELSPDQQAVIRIQDNAKGMNEEVQSKIFEHLFTTKSVGQGTGLGLAIARQIVEDKHRGSIHVNSQLGHGTEFIIILPIKTEKVS
jgi:GAF domain-containing protein